MILALDIGGTAIKMAMVDREGRIAMRHPETPTCADGLRVPVIQAAVNAIRAFLRDTGVSPEGIAVSAAGQIDTRSGVVIGTNGGIPGYEGTPIVQTLEAEFHLSATALNDASAAALGESFAGRARGYHQVLLVTLGTGVGGGVILNGSVYGGRRGIAGEIGHFTLDRNGPVCTCGRKGCFECCASVSALVRKAAAVTGEPTLNGRSIFARAAGGDAVMRALLDRWIDDIACGIEGLVHIFNPEMVLIGGGVSAQKALLIDPLREKVLSRLMPRFAEGLQIEAASLANDAGLIGAAAFWLQKHSQNP